MRTLGLDIGTNSIGWGIVDERAQKIQNCGVYVFPEGVKKEKRNEISKAAERTKFRSERRLKFRRKLRKYETLKVLIQNGMCPLSLEELEKWRTEKTYPMSEAFIKWYRTDENEGWEPYYLRKKCVEQKAEKPEIGRALYHIAQRRGFLSNRKETTKETDGKVSERIKELSAEKGDRTLGQYFYELKKSGEKVRGTYTSRKEHYEAEFNKICEVQNISNELKSQLHSALFFQRKLKSQKLLVGKCTFEQNKPRCPVSHFEFEEFRMLSFINSIRISRNNDEDESPNFQPITPEEIESIKPLFFRSSKPHFDFKDIAKKLRGKHDEWTFNYRDDTNIAGCPVSTELQNVFGDDWKNTRIAQYDIYAIWHVLFDFDDDEKLREFALSKLGLDSEKTKKFCAIHFQQGYANLSLKAIRKILPFLRKGHVYSSAVFLANIPTMIGQDVYEANAGKIGGAVADIMSSLKTKNNIITLANRCLDAAFRDEAHDFHSEDWDKSIIETQAQDLFGKRNWAEKTDGERSDIMREVEEKVADSLKIAVTKNPNSYKYPALRTDNLIEDFLRDEGYAIKKNARLYHPSDTGYSFERPLQGDDGKTYLGSPRTPSVKNPVAMRALHQLRKLLNYLIKTGEIDSDTRVHIELANEVNDKNWRKAIDEFQKKNEERNAEHRKRIVELCKECGFDIIPTDDDVKKFRLWKEQQEQCPYTGKTINICDLFGPHPKFDFEHTIPRSLSYDDSLENLTLCDSDYNRNVKKQHIPSELPDFDETARRFQKFYEEKITNCHLTIKRNRTFGGYDPMKDDKIVERHKAQLELRYYEGKLNRFMAKEVTSGFKHSQLNDTRIITKFALSYVKAVFPRTFPVKGSMTDTFKRQWGLLRQDEAKDRENYRHHAVDALTVACVDRAKFNLLSEAIRKSADGAHLTFAKPWETFDTDVLSAVQYIIPKHFVDDNSLRQTNKVLRKGNGKLKLNKNGQKMYGKGSTARGSLHKDMFYGRIQLPPEKGGTAKEVYVIRIEHKELTKDSANKIIDKGIRDTFLQNLESGRQTLADIQANGILLPYKMNGKDVYVKRIRIKAKPANPIQLKAHTNAISKNPKDYKQFYYVVNEENYLIALYRGKDAKGKTISDYKVSNLLDSVRNKQNGKELYAANSEKNGAPLYKVLKNGKVVILQEDIVENVFSLSKEDLFGRLYRISGIESDGRINFSHLMVAVAKTPQNKNERIDNAIDKYKRITHSKVNCLVEGEDFIISPAGELVPKK